ncbi:hypothetical protein [Streptomyces bauhiniae]
MARLGVSKWRRTRLEDGGAYRWRRIVCHKRFALVWIEWGQR